MCSMPLACTNELVITHTQTHDLFGGRRLIATTAAACSNREINGAGIMRQKKMQFGVVRMLSIGKIE